MESQCDNSSDQLYGGLFGFGKLNGNHWGGQAEFLRVPFADFTSFVVPDTAIPDEKVLFLSDILPTAYWSVQNAGVKQGDTVIILGSGPVGLFAQKVRRYGWCETSDCGRSSYPSTGKGAKLQSGRDLPIG